MVYAPVWRERLSAMKVGSPPLGAGSVNERFAGRSMDICDIDLHDIRVFITTAYSKSFTQVAQRLNCSQQTVSNVVATLEKKLGGSLFIRNLKGVELTPFGALCLESAKDAAKAMRRLACASSSLAQGNMAQSVISVGISRECIRSALARGPHLKGFLQASPGLLLSPIACSSGDGLAALDADALDMLVLSAFRAGRYLLRYPDYPARFICSIPVSVAVSCRNALSAKASLTFEDLQGHLFTQFGPDDLGKLAIIKACNCHGFTPPYIESPSQNSEDFWGRVASDRVVAFMHAWPSCASEHPQCSFIPLLHAEDLALEVYLVHRRNEYRDIAAYLEESLASSLRAPT